MYSCLFSFLPFIEIVRYYSSYTQLAYEMNKACVCMYVCECRSKTIKIFNIHKFMSNMNVCCVAIINACLVERMTLYEIMAIVYCLHSSFSALIHPIYIYSVVVDCRCRLYYIVIHSKHTMIVE